MGLLQSTLETTVEQLPLRTLPTVEPTVSVRDAVIIMQAAQLGAVVVLDEACRAAGQFTEKLLIHMLANNPQALDDPVTDHMEDVTTVTGATKLAELVDRMRDQSMRWMVVVDKNHAPIALTGVRGVIEFIVEHFPRVVRVHPLISRISMQQREGA